MTHYVLNENYIVSELDNSVAFIDLEDESSKLFKATGFLKDIISKLEGGASADELLNFCIEKTSDSKTEAEEKLNLFLTQLLDLKVIEKK